ncbi:superoxide dismutase 2 [Caerostris extrusa]|uniref:Superoxide dismutase n=1 Tax=Caerostris extrusa TaxID=172846 RepID=A0AAV4YFX4_CAEEX|nr:superoxide dismutase 2 [Caerostris extrusa]
MNHYIYLTAVTFLQLIINFVKCSKIAPAFYGLERPALEYELPPLLYTFDELEPYIDEGTAKMHYFEYHGKHASRMSIIDILRNLSHIPLTYRNDLKNFGSGLLNHNLYWATISPNPHGEPRVPVGHIADKITAKFGSFLEFKATFTDMATSHFGSGGDLKSVKKLKSGDFPIKVEAHKTLNYCEGVLSEPDLLTCIPQ